jgi:hypothetical protein
MLLKFQFSAMVFFDRNMDLYELLLWRSNILRFLFGMRLKMKPQQLPASRSEETVA